MPRRSRSMLPPSYRTYTSDYAGSVSSSRGGQASCSFEPSAAQMDRELLLERAPILFSAAVPLYESEMDDHGVSACSVRVRCSTYALAMRMRSCASALAVEEMYWMYARLYAREHQFWCITVAPSDICQLPRQLHCTRCAAC